MKEQDISRATLSRIPAYLNCVKSLPPETVSVSAAAVARQLGLGQVQVRKDFGMICGGGKPKVGYERSELEGCLERCLDRSNGGVVIVGAGKLGRALLDYSGFSDYGLCVYAAFDTAVSTPQASPSGKPIMPLAKLERFCRDNEIKTGIIAVPASEAQNACNQLYKCGVRAMLCFAQCRLYAPPDAVISYENMALSLAHLKMQIKQ